MKRESFFSFRGESGGRRKKIFLSLSFLSSFFSIPSFASLFSLGKNKKMLCAAPNGAKNQLEAFLHAWEREKKLITFPFSLCTTVSPPSPPPKKKKRKKLSSQESVDRPVLFYVDPEIDDDPRIAGIDTVTLSYTFFLVDDGKKSGGGNGGGEEAKAASSAAAAVPADASAG